MNQIFEEQNLYTLDLDQGKAYLTKVQDHDCSMSDW